MYLHRHYFCSRSHGPGLPLLRPLLLTLLFAPTVLYAQPGISLPQLSPAQQVRLVEGVKIYDQGTQLFNQGKAIEALPKVVQAVGVSTELLGAGHSVTAEARHTQGLIEYTIGRFSEAQASFEASLSVRRKIYGSKLETAETLNALGLVLRVRDDYSGAAKALEEALAIRRSLLGMNNTLTAGTLTNLGGLSQTIGDTKRAKAYYEQALAIQLKQLGAKHSDTIVTLNNLGILLTKVDEFAAAKPLLDQAVSSSLELYGENHTTTGDALVNLGYWYQATGDLAKAKELYARAYSSARAAVGNHHLSTAIALNALGWEAFAERDYRAARPYFTQAESIFRVKSGELHPDTTVAMYNVALTDAAAGNWNAVADEADRGRHISRRMAVSVLPSLKEKEQLAFLELIDVEAFQGCLTVGLVRREESRFRDLSAGWLLNGKAVAHETLAQRALLVSRLREQGGKSANLDKLLANREQLASLSMSAPQPGAETAYQKQLTELQERDEALSRELGAVPSFQASDPWIELAAVRKAVPADGVLVEMARFRVLDFPVSHRHDRWLPAHYAAWIIPAAGAGSVELIDLGDAQQIDDAVLRFRTVLDSASIDLQKLGEIEAEKKLHKPLAEIAKLVLEPLLPYVNKSKQLLLSPDGNLWLVPWAALPVDDDYLVARWDIRYLVSGRDLVCGRSSPASVSTGAPVIFANPDYDLGANERMTNTQKVLRDKMPATTLNSRGFRSANKLPAVPRLPGTASEAKAIEPKLAALANTKPIQYSDQYALETIFKTLHSPRVLVVSTHGFFLPQQELQSSGQDAAAPSAGRAAALTKEGSPLENPLLRCGLLLAGCNQQQKASDPSVDDGVLTGLEIVGVDLRATELVVLSACETGLGKVQNGEGVAGLRQAFQLAGAQSVVATLWQIPDQATAQLMNDFFANLAAGQSKADSLRNAQLKTIKARREKYGAAHPLFWAAFTLTGQ